MKKVFLFICSLFLITGCSLSKSDDKSKMVDFSSYNDKFTVTASDKWKAVSNKGELNDSADIEISDAKNQKYMIALMESKEDISWSYDEYSEFILNQNSTIYDVTLDDIKTTKIGGYNANWVEFKTQPSGINIYMRIYVVETENYYGQILIWTKYSSKDDVKEEFDKIVSSFKEVK